MKILELFEMKYQMAGRAGSQVVTHSYCFYCFRPTLSNKIAFFQIIKNQHTQEITRINVLYLFFRIYFLLDNTNQFKKRSDFD